MEKQMVLEKECGPLTDELNVVVGLFRMALLKTRVAQCQADYAKEYDVLLFALWPNW